MSQGGKYCDRVQSAQHSNDRDFTSVYCLSRVKVLQTLRRLALLNNQVALGNITLVILEDGPCEKLLQDTGTHYNRVASSCS